MTLDPALYRLGSPPRLHFSLYSGPKVHDHIMHEGKETGLVILRDMDTREPVGFELFGNYIVPAEEHPTDSD